MAQNIVIAGATFNAVPSIVVPTSNNGTAVFVDPSPTTATDSDVASGKVYFKADGTQSTGTASGGSATLITKSITANGTYNASSDNADGYSSVTVNVSGGGGSNVVSGTFTCTATKGTAQTISIPYSGNGYPVALAIWPVTPIKDFPRPYASGGIAQYFMTKYNENAPTYGTGEDNYGAVCMVYGNANSTYANSRGSYNYNSYSSSDASGSSYNTCVKFKSKNSLSIYVSGTSYGFIAGEKYNYTIVYSS